MCPQVRERERFIEEDSRLKCSSKLPLHKPQRREEKRGVAVVMAGRKTAMKLINLKNHFVVFLSYLHTSALTNATT